MARRLRKGPLSVLLVDDNPSFLEAVEAFLKENAGVRIAGRASSGPEAIECVKRLHPGLVLLDLAMPGMTGLETARRIKEMPDGPPVVILTLYDQMEYRLAAKAARADGFIPKTEITTALVPLIRSLSSADPPGDVG